MGEPRNWNFLEEVRPRSGQSDATAQYLHTWAEFAGDEFLGTHRPNKCLWNSDYPKVAFKVVGTIHENLELCPEPVTGGDDGKS